MPSFDIVSELDMHEVSNAVDQANREITNRFDFKGTGAKYEIVEQMIVLTAQVDFQLQQMLDVLRGKLAKRQIDIACLEEREPVITGQQAKQEVLLRQGIDTALAKKMVKQVKDAKLKVQCAIQGEQLRVTGKKRDDLQTVIAMFKESDIDLPLQYKNFRD
ncbi:MAG: YajQ family cyclic di-GMP-binding protein [Chromatiales bacterium]|jgi:uncharacterized protein YajQ (UPF0234 family)|nr:YajQ family cyclic di-GMP-binding protein [Chromatiales bacterium]MDH3931638.1 YajQ family cyclic di-GMP-binding protein [Chromatiales bacterium]MDH3945045.1 YajQ family cyclic di-GMP-binding protein [Chromatiales bacterium]MDH4014303.1 YajQ family cyclic di-GMP-binding protein [Chromatiales bacterium]PLX55382.1 MAG: YajQ family cyclic di-GMP-binding protein [Chromatiales bacterium]